MVVRLAHSGQEVMHVATHDPGVTCIQPSGPTVVPKAQLPLHSQNTGLGSSPSSPLPLTEQPNKIPALHLLMEKTQLKSLVLHYIFLKSVMIYLTSWIISE